MQLPKRRLPASQPSLPFLDPSQAELWTSLSAEQQQTCQQLLSQLLQQILHDLSGTNPSEQSRGDHDRQASA